MIVTETPNCKNYNGNITIKNFVITTACALFHKGSLYQRYTEKYQKLVLLPSYVTDVFIYLDPRFYKVLDGFWLYILRYKIIVIGIRLEILIFQLLMISKVNFISFLSFVMCPNKKY